MLVPVLSQSRQRPAFKLKVVEEERRGDCRRQGRLLSDRTDEKIRRGLLVKREWKEGSNDADQGQGLEAALAVCVAVTLPYPAGRAGAQLGACDDLPGLLHTAFGEGELLCAVDLYSGMSIPPLSPLIYLVHPESKSKVAVPTPINRFYRSYFLSFHLSAFEEILLTTLLHTSSSPSPPSPSPPSSSPASSTSTAPSNPSTTSTSTASSPSYGASASRCCPGTSASPWCIAVRLRTGPPRPA